jgi:signal transduction histidine kinase
MASLGMLVAGIAHEINTPIGAVSSIHNTLVRAVGKLRQSIYRDGAIDKQELSEVDTTLKLIDDANRVIANGVDRVTTIVRRLRSFARLDEAILKTVEVHEGIEDTLTLIHHQIKHHIRVERDFGELPRIACYPGQLNQVFLNLLNNARQAVSGEGTITIRTRAAGKTIVLEFSDTGPGIQPEHVAKVFDPGFTTKGVGVGTGLGLSICYQIVQDHHGSIDVQSSPGRGTTFRVTLPTNLDELLEREGRGT